MFQKGTIEPAGPPERIGTCRCGTHPMDGKPAIGWVCYECKCRSCKTCGKVEEKSTQAKISDECFACLEANSVRLRVIAENCPSGRGTLLSTARGCLATRHYLDVLTGELWEQEPPAPSPGISGWTPSPWMTVAVYPDLKEQRAAPRAAKVDEYTEVSHHDCIPGTIRPDRTNKPVHAPTFHGARAVDRDHYLIALQVIDRLEAGDTSIAMDISRGFGSTSAKITGTRVTKS